MKDLVLISAVYKKKQYNEIYISDYSIMFKGDDFNKINRMRLCTNKEPSQ